MKTTRRQLVEEARGLKFFMTRDEWKTYLRNRREEAESFVEFKNQRLVSMLFEVILTLGEVVFDHIEKHSR